VPHMPSERAEPGEILARIWQDALKVPAVRETDDFFDLGGNSLQAIQIVSRVRDAFGVDVTVDVLDRASAFADFAAAVDAALAARPAAVREP